MTAEPEPPAAGDLRSAPRTNMFIAAVMHGPAGRSEAKIRNMSPLGAMVEAPVLPPVGSAIELMRGSLCVAGQVMWSDSRRCGVRFLSGVVVGDWLANPLSRGQQQVERIVSQVRAGTLTEVPRDRTPASALADLPSDVAKLTQLLERLGEDLADDPDMLARHPRSVQSLDIAMQMLEALGDALAPEATVRAGGLDRLARLRDSAGEALAP